MKAWKTQRAPVFNLTPLSFCICGFRKLISQRRHIPEHPSRPFLDQTLCEHSGGLVRRAAKLAPRCKRLPDLCFAICRFSRVRFITPSDLTHNLLFYLQSWYISVLQCQSAKEWVTCTALMIIIIMRKSLGNSTSLHKLARVDQFFRILISRETPRASDSWSSAERGTRSTCSSFMDKFMHGHGQLTRVDRTDPTALTRLRLELQPASCHFAELSTTLWSQQPAGQRITKQKPSLRSSPTTPDVGTWKRRQPTSIRI